MVPAAPGATPLVPARLNPPPLPPAAQAPPPPRAQQAPSQPQNSPALPGVAIVMPGQQPVYRTTAPDAAALAQTGRALFREASESLPTAPAPPPAVGAPAPAPPPGRTLVVVRDQAVQEDAEQYKAHDIISVYDGETVTLLEGSPETGLPAPYADYVRVRRSDGREGHVSRFVMRA